MKTLFKDNFTKKEASQRPSHNFTIDIVIFKNSLEFDIGEENEGLYLFKVETKLKVKGGDMSSTYTII